MFCCVSGVGPFIEFVWVDERGPAPPYEHAIRARALV